MGRTRREVTIRLMVGRREFLCGLIGLLLIANPGYLGTEQLTMTTVYPSPYGVYQEMRATGNTYMSYGAGGTMAVGTNSPTSGKKFEVAGDAQIFQDVTIGDPGNTTAPLANINVSGAVSLGNENTGTGELTSRKGYLTISAEDGRVRLGTDESQYLDRACRLVTYVYGTSTSCPNGGQGWSVIQAGTFNANQRPKRVWMNSATGAITSVAPGPLPVAPPWEDFYLMHLPEDGGQMLCCKMAQY